MHIDSSVLSSLNLETFVKTNIGRWRDRFPPMIMERCLEQSPAAVIKYIMSTYAGSAYVPAEVITMPRAGFGPRPVIITDLPSRLLYSALVSALETSLPEPTRALGVWDKYQRFALNGTHEYVVELDIASCYEYIDHDLLKNELILRSMNLNVCTALAGYLNELMTQRRGIPQMLTASDRLADAYLSVLDRKLARDGYLTFRYVDDVRIIAKNWETANTAIEQAAEYARELGLILSSKKTSIYRQSTLIDQQEQDATLFNSHVDDARAALTKIWFVGEYDQVEQVEIEPAEQEAALAATWNIFTEWWKGVHSRVA